MRASGEGVDLYAIIKGAQYAFHVEPALADNDRVYFSIPAKSEHTVNIGVHVSKELEVKVYEIPWEVVIASGKMRAGHFEVTLDENADDLRRITDFSVRL